MTAARQVCVSVLVLLLGTAENEIMLIFFYLGDLR